MDIGDVVYIKTGKVGTICDTIKEMSNLSTILISIFLHHFLKTCWKMLYFDANTQSDIWLPYIVMKDLTMLKQYAHCFCQYPKNNIPDIRLIPLDSVTYPPARSLLWREVYLLKKCISFVCPFSLNYNYLGHNKCTEYVASTLISRWKVLAKCAETNYQFCFA